MTTAKIEQARLQIVGPWIAENNRKVRSVRFPLLLILLHLPAGILFYQSKTLAAAHAFLTLAVGLYAAFRKDVSLVWIAFIAFYICGSEVLWRMARADIFWEFGKYSAAFILITALVRRQYWTMPSAPAVYLFLLMPACFLVLFSSDLGEAKDKMSFNISGPFLLFVGTWFFSNARFRWSELKSVLFGLILPILSIAVVSLFFTMTLEEIDFGTESNFSTSGGFGPNQVSSVLGLGVFICGSCLLLFKNSTREQLILGALLLFFAAQSMLTFSRGGMYNAIGALVVLILVGIRSLKRDLVKLLPIAIIAPVFILLIFPALDNFTGGALLARFEDTEATGRMEIIEADVQIFSENSILGAGVGQAAELREQYIGRAVGAHTEFARVLAEHGILGVLALIVLIVGTALRIWEHRFGLMAAFGAGAVAWSSLFMMNAGMRLAAPSLIWGLSFLSISTFIPSRFHARNERNDSWRRLEVKG